MKSPRILYFIDGPAPNSANKLEANALRGNGATVCFRNARYAAIEDGSAPEKCDGVAGVIPKGYEDVAKADAAIELFRASQEAEIKALKAAGGDEDNNGTHTLPNRAQVPVAARVRPADGATQATPTAPPETQPGAGASAPAFGAPPAFDPANPPKA